MTYYDEVFPPEEVAAAPVDRASTPEQIDEYNRTAPLMPGVSGLNNAYTAEQEREAALQLSGRDKLAAQRANLEAAKAAHEYAYGQKFRSLIKGGASPEEAARYALSELDDASKIAGVLSKLPVVGKVPSTINSVPIIDPTTGKQIGHGVYDQGGRLHATRMINPDALTPDESAQRHLLDMQIRSDTEELGRLSRMKGNIEQRALNPDLDATIAAVTKRLDENRKAFLNRGIPAPAAAQPAPTAKAIDKAKADEVRAAYRAGKIKREDAVAQLKELGFD